MDGVAALERSYDQMGGLVANLDAKQLLTPTPCADWDVRAMLNHTFGAGWMFTLVNRGEALGEDSGDLVGDDPAKALAELAPANLAAWRQPGALDGDRTYPFGTFPAPAALMVNVGEIALHAWDLAQATGQDATIDPEIAATVWDFYQQVPIDDYRAHGAFGAEVKVPDSASIQERLLGFVGRQP